MLFGYIKDYFVCYNYIDLKTNKVFKSFDSDLKRVQWLRNLSLESFLIVSGEMKLEEIKVFWYENNFELLKFIFPFLILFHFIGYWALLAFGFCFTVCFLKTKNDYS